MLEESVLHDYLTGPENLPEIKEAILEFDELIVFDLAKRSGWLLYEENIPTEEEWEEFNIYRRESRIFLSAVEYLTGLLYAGRHPGEEKAEQRKKKEIENRIELENTLF